jgi:hypothetical protein
MKLSMHAAAEPFLVALYIAGPWIFGFADVDDAKTVSIVLGVLVLLTTLMTRWRMALVKVLPLSAHRTADILVGLVAILSPFVLGFSDQGGPTRFLIVVGVAEIGAALMTRWDERDDFAVSRTARATTA